MTDRTITIGKTELHFSPVGPDKFKLEIVASGSVTINIHGELGISLVVEDTSREDIKALCDMLAEMLLEQAIKHNPSRD